MGCGAPSGTVQMTQSLEPTNESEAIVQNFDDNIVRPCCLGECTDIGDVNFDHTLGMVSNVPALRLIPKVDMLKLVQIMTRQEYTVGEKIIEQGVRNDKLFIILSGEAKIFRVVESTEAILATLHGGDYFGEQGLLQAGDARATVRASGDSASTLITCSISHTTLREVGLHKWLRIPKRRAVVDWKTAKRHSMGVEHPGLELKSPGTPKTQQEREFIARALRRNIHFSDTSITNDTIEDLVGVASLYKVAAGEMIMKSGDLQPTSFYVVHEGAFDVLACRCRGRHCIKQMREESKELTSAMPGDSFGEVELLHSAPCQASVTSSGESALWIIKAFDFIDAMRSALQAKFDVYIEILRNLEVFSGLLQEEVHALAEVVTELSYNIGEEVITQGEIGNTFFVLVEGSAVAACDGQEVRKLHASRAQGVTSYFGEMELMRPQRRTATIRITSESATMLALPRAGFEMVLEPLDEILRDIVDHSDHRPSKSKRTPNCRTPRSVHSGMTLQSRDVTREYLQLCGRLGSGGFGFVDLALHRKTQKQYALKRMLREKISDQRQKEQIMIEKKILTLCNSPFVIGLRATFRDASSLAFLLEFASGGDLMDALHSLKLHGNANSARFFSAGVLLALDHLHDLQIIYRDLKPENILLDAQGWPKLTDFGLATIFSGDKTFTCCGTPCYMAPEMWLRIGHNRAIDWWSFGVLLHEIMSGRTPFENDEEDQESMREAIEQGISNASTWAWPLGFTPQLQALISGLLRPFAPQRLPMQLGGVANIKKHSWYTASAFDWEAYAARTLRPPHSEASIDMEHLPPSLDDWTFTGPPTSTWDAEF